MEAAYTTPELVAQRREVLRLLALQPGESVLDIGAGPGFLAAEMAAAVEPGGRVFAVDPSESMRELARSRGAALEIRRRLRRGAAAARRRGRRGGRHAGARVRARRAGRAGRDPARAAPRRAGAGAGHGLGLDRLAQRRSRPHASGARGLGGAPGRSLAAADPRRRPAGRGLREVPPSVWPLLNTGAARGTFSAGLVPLIAEFVVGRRGVDAATARAGATTSTASARRPSSASTATCSARASREGADTRSSHRRRHSGRPWRGASAGAGCSWAPAPQHSWG